MHYSQSVGKQGLNNKYRYILGALNSTHFLLDIAVKCTGVIDSEPCQCAK